MNLKSQNVRPSHISVLFQERYFETDAKYFFKKNAK